MVQKAKNDLIETHHINENCRRDTCKLSFQTYIGKNVIRCSRKVKKEVKIIGHHLQLSVNDQFL